MNKNFFTFLLILSASSMHGMLQPQQIKRHLYQAIERRDVGTTKLYLAFVNAYNFHEVLLDNTNLVSIAENQKNLTCPSLDAILTIAGLYLAFGIDFNIHDYTDSYKSLSLTAKAIGSCFILVAASNRWEIKKSHKIYTLLQKKIQAVNAPLPG